MTIAEDVERDLWNRVAFCEVREKYRSLSKTYEGLRRFLDKADKTVVEYHRKLEDLDISRVQVQSEVDELGCKRENLDLDVIRLNEDKSRLSDEISEQREELDRLALQKSELVERGYCGEIMEKISKLEARKGPELLRQVKTVEQHYQIKKEVANLKRNKRTVKKQIENLQTDIKEIRSTLNSERNELDEIRLESLSIREALNVASGFLEDGLNAQDLKSLRYALKHYQISGNPALSVSRLIKGLVDHKTLLKLRDEVDIERRRLKAQKLAVAEAENKFEILERTAKEAIEDVKDSAIESVDHTAGAATSTISRFGKDFGTIVDERLERLDVQIQSSMEKIEAKFGEYVDFQHKKRFFEESVYPIAVLLDGKNPEGIRQVPALFVLELLNRIEFWFAHNLPDVTVIGFQYIFGNGAVLFGRAKIVELLDLISEVIRQRILKEKTNSRNSQGD